MIDFNEKPLTLEQLTRQLKLLSRLTYLLINMV
jgi:hypothetical protein